MECPSCGNFLHGSWVECDGDHWHRRFVCLCGVDIIDMDKEYNPK